MTIYEYAYYIWIYQFWITDLKDITRNSVRNINFRKTDKKLINKIEWDKERQVSHGALTL